MAAFLLITQVGVSWPALYPISYVSKTVILAILLFVLRGSYTKISWNYWWLGAVVGVVGVIQWIAMQGWLELHFEFFRRSADAAVFDPTSAFASPGVTYAFIGLRWLIGASIVVPVMEELFWRDFLWRQIIAPSNFKLARVGEWSLSAFLTVAVMFSFVHGNWWLTAIVWGLMVGGLLAYTRSLGACIVAHAVTNFLLGAYVLIYKDWGLW